MNSDDFGPDEPPPRLHREALADLQVTVARVREGRKAPPTFDQVCMKWILEQGDREFTVQDLRVHLRGLERRLRTAWALPLLRCLAGYGYLRAADGSAMLRRWTPVQFVPPEFLAPLVWQGGAAARWFVECDRRGVPRPHVWPWVWHAYYWGPRPLCAGHEAAQMRNACYSVGDADFEAVAPGNRQCKKCLRQLGRHPVAPLQSAGGS